MRNWSTDTTELKKDQKEYAVWQLEQMVNFGAGEERISRADLKKYWTLLNLDANKRNFLSILLWPEKS